MNSSSSIVITLVFLLATAPAARAQVIALWTFNSVTPDANHATGTLAPAFGAGSMATIGVNNSGFGFGSPTDPDSAGDDNSALFTYGYPQQPRTPGTAGIRVDTGTEGQASISVSYEQQNTARSSAWWRFEYTVDGVMFTSSGLPVTGPGAPGEYPFPNDKVDDWALFTWDLSSIAGVADNPAFAFRIVSIYAPNATRYVGTTTQTSAGYAPSGIVLWDMLTVRAAPTHQSLCCRGSTCLVSSAACSGANTLVIPTVGVCNSPANSRSPCCKADYNHVGGITVQDIFDYLSGWFMKDIGADINGNPPSTPAGVTVQDIFDFLSAWFARGC